jgi:hypothetical protein
MCEPNDQIHQVCLLAPHSFLLNSCLLQFLIPQALYPSHGFFLNQVGTTVPFARHTHDLLLVLDDQPTYDQHTFSLVDHQSYLFLGADHH